MYPEQTINLLLEYFKNSPELAGIIQKFGEQVDLIEDQLTLLSNCFNIDSSTGDQLDMLGTLVGEPRNGLVDADYRLMIKFRAIMNNSEGDPEAIINCAKTLSNADKVEYIEIYPARIILHLINGVTVQNLKSMIKKIVPGGVGLEVTISSDNPFVFYGDPDGEGFNSLTSPTSGGEFSSLI